MIYDVVLPSKPKVIREDGVSGTYEIDGLYPGYGHTLLATLCDALSYLPCPALP